MRRYQDRVDLGFEFSQTLMKKLAQAVTPLGVNPPESFGDKLVYIMGNTTCEPKPGNVCLPEVRIVLYQDIAQDSLQAQECHPHTLECTVSLHPAVYGRHTFCKLKPAPDRDLYGKVSLFH